MSNWSEKRVEPESSDASESTKSDAHETGPPKEEWVMKPLWQRLLLSCTQEERAVGSGDAEEILRVRYPKISLAGPPSFGGDPTVGVPPPEDVL